MNASVSAANVRFSDVWDQPTTLELVREPLIATTVTLDAEQTAVVRHRGGPLLVLAGPGTGKTTTLIEAMADRLCGSDALGFDQVLGLTFGREAADSWRHRVALRVGGQPPTITTFHSFAFSLLRRFPDVLQLSGPPRLLAGYEEQNVVADVIAAALRIGQVQFPENLRIAALTSEFGRQLRAVMTRARSVGITAQVLRQQAQSARDVAWELAAELYEKYEDFLADTDAFDYSSLIVTATAIARTPHVQRELHSRYQAIFVDEYQDTDRAQVELLKAVVGPTADVIAVGDPDQSIYAFRGADVQGIFRFHEDFGSPGREATSRVLRTCRRFSPALREVADVGLSRVSYAGTSLWQQIREQHRRPVCTGGLENAQVVDIVLCADERVQAGEVAEFLRRMHQQGTAYNSMAVLVRTADQIAPILRQLVANGVPAHARGDEAPVATNSAVIALLDALIAVEAPQDVTPELAEALLRSPLCGLDPVYLRSLIRAIRDDQRRSAPDTSPASSSELLIALATDSTVLTDISAQQLPEAQALVVRWHTILAAAREERARGATPEQVLWSLWQAVPAWAQGLQNRSLRGGAAGRRADRDLDAVMALFDMAAKASRTSAKSGIRFAEEVRKQVVGVASTQPAQLRDHVSVMTAHRAKGLEWDVVAVCGLQEGVWPNLRLRGGLLGADRLTTDGLGSGLQLSELLAEERRLFYVAVTRARKHLWLSAISGEHAGGDDGRPSVLLRELFDPADPHTPLLPQISLRSAQRRRRGALNAADLAARLRQVVADPLESEFRRGVAAEQLARLIDLPEVAPPSQWWGVRERTISERPVRPAGPVHLSASALDRITHCSLAWFLEREVQAVSPKTTVLAFGLLIHSVCEHISTAATRPTMGELGEFVDAVWADMGFPAAWVARQERVRVSQALQRFVLWHDARLAEGWRVHGVEVDFRAQLPVTSEDGETHDVVLRGRMDRVEVSIDEAGDDLVVVYDLKTNRSDSTAEEVREHVQLQMYRRVVHAGGLEGINATTHTDAGLVLVSMDASSKSAQAKVRTQGTSAAAVDVEIDAVIGAAAQRIRGESFVATPGKHCSWCRLTIACPAKVRENVMVEGGDHDDDES